MCDNQKLCLQFLNLPDQIRKILAVMQPTWNISSSHSNIFPFCWGQKPLNTRCCKIEFETQSRFEIDRVIRSMASYWGRPTPRNQESVYVGGQSRLTDKTTRKIRSERKKQTISRSLSYFNLSHSEFMFRKSFPGNFQY